MAYHTMATGDAELRTLQAEVRTLAWRMTTGDADVRTLAWRMATGDADVRTLQAEVRTLAWRMAYGDEELRTLQAEVRTFQPGMRTFHWMTRYADDLQGHRKVWHRKCRSMGVKVPYFISHMPVLYSSRTYSLARPIVDRREGNEHSSPKVSPHKCSSPSCNTFELDVTI